jgi:endonuclease VIII-like 1
LPEQPEVRIMSDFINSEIGQRSVRRVEKSPLFKTKCDFSPLSGKEWKVSSQSRGKEMIIKFLNEEEELYMKVNFAKIGSVETYELNESGDVFDKRALIRFYTDDKLFSISDFTRFIIVRWTSDWDTNRSPDIVFQHNDWRDLLYEKRRIAYFDRPIFDILTDQRFFNGIGNFSRSEILARTRFSPFTPFSEVLSSDILRNDFFEITREVLNEIHNLGGLQFKHWTNPFGKKGRGFSQWMRAYNKPRKAYFHNDSKGKKFWFEKRWAREYLEWTEATGVQNTTLPQKIYRKIKNQKRWQ